MGGRAESIGLGMVSPEGTDSGTGRYKLITMLVLGRECGVQTLYITHPLTAHNKHRFNRPIYHTSAACGAATAARIHSIRIYIYAPCARDW